MFEKLSKKVSTYTKVGVVLAISNFRIWSIFGSREKGRIQVRKEKLYISFCWANLCKIKLYLLDVSFLFSLFAILRFEKFLKKFSIFSKFCRIDSLNCRLGWMGRMEKEEKIKFAPALLSLILIPLPKPSSFGKTYFTLEPVIAFRPIYISFI